MKSLNLLFTSIKVWMSFTLRSGMCNKNLYLASIQGGNYFCIYKSNAEITVNPRARVGFFKMARAYNKNLIPAVESNYLHGNKALKKRLHVYLYSTDSCMICFHLRELDFSTITSTLVLSV
jgi:hypothetical protein